MTRQGKKNRNQKSRGLIASPLICVSLLFTLLFASNCYAGWVRDYEGSLGNEKIGFTIISNKISSDIINDGDIAAVNYFYNKHMVDIELKIQKQEKRHIIFEEHNKKGELAGVFDLTFAKKDPHKHFNSEADLVTEVLVGSWKNAKGDQEYPVYLKWTHAVSGDAEGGRCYLNGEQYRKVEARVKEFHAAVLRGDTKLLKDKFNYTISSSRQKKFMANIIPHHMFCRHGAYMIGSGFWFDEEGNPLKP